jgi:hypothetical protein
VPSSGLARQAEQNPVFLFYSVLTLYNSRYFSAQLQTLYLKFPLKFCFG